MPRPLDRHIDGEELDALLSLQAPSVGHVGRLSEEAFREAQHHVESCQDCDRKLQMHRSVQSELFQQMTTGNAVKGPNCSDESTWLNVAAGLLVDTEARERLKHAAECGYCGPLLKSAAKTLSDESSPDEEVLLQSLTSARASWQAQMAQTLKSGNKPRRISQSRTSFWTTFLFWPRPAFAVVGFALFVAAAWIGVHTLRPLSATELLAQAYTEHRTIEVRIPGARYAPLRVERSGAASNFEKPEPLLKAEALIGEELRQNPNDPEALEGKARAELLDGSYDDAIKTLQRALESKPDSPQLQTDLGSAYFLRAKSADRPVDYGFAINSFGRALATNADDPIALFNRALACGESLDYKQAIKDWEHYLQIDPHGEWSEEARSRLAAVKEKVDHQHKGQIEPILSPAQIAAGAENDTALEAKIDERVEQYLHVAIADWLPQAFSGSSSQPSANALAALLQLSKVTQQMHGDMWLTDLLTSPKSKNFSAGVKVLAASVRANDRGDYAEGQRLAHQAASLFDVPANSAGRIRAQAEEVYSDHLLWEGQRCLALLRVMTPALTRTSYTWIQGQMSLERSNCANAVGDLDTYQSAIGRGLRQAKEHNYIALYLRALGFQALSYGSAGDVNTAFSITAEGLKLFWSRRVDLMKGYNLYFNLESVVEELRLPYLQVVLLQEATNLIDEHPDVLQRAMAHRWYGNAAYAANMPELAASEFSLASALFAASPRTVATTRDYMDAEVWRAHAEIAQGDLQRAAERLQAIQPTLETSPPSFDPEIGFYTAQADIAMQRSDPTAAESAIRSAVFLAEWALTSYLSDDDRRQWAEETRTTYREAVEWRLRQGDSTSALELWEWYRGAEFRAAESARSKPPEEVRVVGPPDPRNAPPLPAPTIVASRLPLMHDETVVAYAVFRDGIAIWVYDDRGVFSHWVSTSLPQMEELVLHFERLCSDPTSDLATLRGTAHLLYNVLIGPVENQFQPNRTILFEPDDSLAGLPWSALVDGDSHYLAERYAMVVTTSLYRAMRIKQAIPITRDTGALVVSVPSAESLPSLSDADYEAQSVSGQFSSARWLHGSNATLAAIHREVRGMGVFHFAGHAVASPLRSGLLLAEVDPTLRGSRMITAKSFAPQEIGSLQLAVLSACHTGGEAQFGRAGTESLVDAFLRSGVPHVVASLWNVDSRETAEFMKEFYNRLLSGSDAAHAILAARLSLASSSTSAHPYYWSAFELQGTA